MIENLYEIDWQNLQAAQGWRSLIPDFITSLTSSSPEVWHLAFEELESALWHQGMVYETTALIVPSLIALLEHESVQWKQQIVLLLADLAFRCSLPRSESNNDDEDENPWAGSSSIPFHSDREQQSQQRVWIQHVHDAIRQGTNVFLSLLNNNDPAIRMTIPYLLSALQDETSETRYALRARFLQETDPQVKASILWAFGSQAEYASADEPLSREMIVAQHEHLLVRIVASLSYVRYAQEHTPDETVFFLLNTFPPSQDIEAMYEALPWATQANAALVSMLCTSLVKLGLKHADLFIAKLFEILDHLERSDQMRGSRHARDYATFDVVSALLYFGFQGKSIQAKDIPFLLTSVQRAVLKAILANEMIVDHAQELTEMMEAYDLPSPWKLRLFLGVEIPSPLVRLEPPQF